jgi:threonine dehydrogenase-like Zn-dependent dehydrogenase
MKALHWDGTAVRVEERDPPAVDADMALVRVHLAGVCNTDLELVRGYMGFRGVLGHEFVGTVAHGPPDWCDRRVVGEINFACGTCARCRDGLGRHCPQRRVMGILDADGAFAEYVAVPIANLYAVPESVPDEAAVFAEPLAASFEILEQVHVAPNTEAIVLGDGKLGLLAAQVLHRAGARVLAVGRHVDKLAILKRRGIDTVLADDWRAAPADLVVEATGSAAGLARAVAATRPRGTLVLKSTVAGSTQLDLAAVVINEIQIVGSRCGPFAPALAALADGSVEVRQLIYERFALRDAVAALERASEPGILKVLIDPEVG